MKVKSEKLKDRNYKNIKTKKISMFELIEAYILIEITIFLF